MKRSVHGEKPPRVRRVGVLADDLTGAGDVALAFEAAGYRTEIGIFNGSKILGPGSNVRVWILDTESRNLSDRGAAGRVRQALGALLPWRPGFFFKKIDSTLRGPVKAELAAFLAVLRPTAPVWVVPAFPRMGRTTVAGRHFVDGVPLDQGAFSRDPRHPVRSSEVAKIVCLDGERRGAEGWDLRVPDVSRESDLARVARCVGADGRVAVGSAGFAAALAREMARSESPARRKIFSCRLSRGAPVAAVVGSAHPLSARQVERLANLSPQLDVSILRVPGRRGDPRRILKTLLRRASGLATVRRWVATGGETAFSLVRRWREFRWRVVGGVEPGVPLCRSLGKPRRYLVMKPGGFGSERVLIKAVKCLMGKATP